ncbi:hypothetical protein F4775DRAFT_572888 [Biscogniauxia sp. FL1348]|nr:hypothetical protein F4775DRAFT_572888 [Biscogniauxia sp. FL1348]
MTTFRPTPTSAAVVEASTSGCIRWVIIATYLAILFFATLPGLVGGTPLSIYAHCTGTDEILLFRERLRRMSRDHIVRITTYIDPEHGFLLAESDRVPVGKASARITPASAS